MNLTDWTSDLRQRNVNLTVTDGVFHIRGGPSDRHDRDTINRHRHALTVAAAGTHPDWWNHTTHRHPHPHPADLQLPPATDNPDEWACATCGHTAHHLDHNLLPWCPTHRPATT